MKRILYIAQQAYPVRSSEAICNSKVAYSLAEAGYLVDVFTYNYKSTYPEDSRIDSVLRDSDNLSIYEIEGKNQQFFLSSSKSIKNNVVSFFHMIKMFLNVGYFYNGISHAYDILNAVKKHVESEKVFPYDIVITRAYYSELAAFYLKEKFGVKWIANWNDPYPLSRFPAPYGNGPKARIEFGYKRVYNKVKRLVDFHTFPSERLRNYMLGSFGDVDKKKTAVIPHMAHSKLLPRAKNDNGNCLRIVSCGSVQNPRNPSLFIKAMKAVVDEMELTAQEIQCFFIGKYDPFLDQIVKENHLEDYISLTGPKQYADCLDFISTCNLSLIIEAQCDEGIYLPTKFADAVQCRVPVFCVSPQPGTLKDLVEKYHNGYYSDNTSLDSIKAVLNQAVMDFRKGSFPLVSKEKMAVFFEEDIVKKISSIFTELELEC